MKKLLTIVILLICLCVPVGAGTVFPGEEIPDSEIVNVKGVKLNSTCVVLPVYKSAKLTKIIAPKNATNKRVKWRCSNPDIIRLTQRGYVISKKPGRAVVVVETQDGHRTASCIITVLPVTISGRKIKYNAKDYLVRLAGG